MESVDAVSGSSQIENVARKTHVATDWFGTVVLGVWTGVQQIFHCVFLFSMQLKHRKIHNNANKHAKQTHEHSNSKSTRLRFLIEILLSTSFCICLASAASSVCASASSSSSVTLHMLPSGNNIGLGFPV